MARSQQTEIRMRLVIENPVANVVHSLQDKKNQPIEAKTSEDGAALTFDFPIRIAAGPKFYGEQVRSEGSGRRFVYIATGQQAGDKASCWNRRMKIDIHDIPQALVDEAMKGKVLEGTVEGTGKDGGPAAATVLSKYWRTV